VDAERPVEFRFLSHARFGDEVVLQLNYLIWFPERPARDGLMERLLAGRLDGVLWRVTLDAEGEVLAGESVHACGCYYMAFPGARLRQVEDPPGPEPVFIGPQMPSPAPGERVRITLESGSHYVVGLDTVLERDLSPVEMAVLPADSLRSLPAEGGRRSLYGPGSGIVRGTERGERWLLWPMGVPSPGAMRQPGRHAIAFVGRRHFDDPRLLDRQVEQRAPGHE
jgi:hypothetical protein